MRPFEVALTIFLVIAALVELTSLSRLVKSFFVFLCLLLAIIHLGREGGHWQMLPVYIAVVVLAVGLAIRRTITVSLLVLTLCLAGAALSFAVPMFSLPKPTGAYPVGTRIVYLRDDSRKEDAGSDRTRDRELIVQVWYPAESSSNHLAPYRRWRESRLKNSYQSVLWTNSREDAVVSAKGGPFPVILFGHGWGATRISDTFIAEDLASHGYVVIATDHPYNSNRVALPDGRVINGILGSPILDLGIVSADKTEALWNMELQKWTADQIFVLNTFQAANLDPQSPWHGHLNTEMVGALGHSFGGSAAERICSVDPRVRSAINMDGWTFDGVRDRSEGKSLMWMYEDSVDPQHLLVNSPVPAEHVNAELDIRDEKNVLSSLERFGGYRLVIDGALHGDFTDQPLVSPFRRITHTGPIKPARMEMIVRDYALAFFNKTLYGKGSSLLDSGNTSPFKEVHFEQWPAK
ncbi:alpha/beta hydrolase family protein [Edaphobacter flagellatus]|uniref:alpha/beta hydrolase family protein n=1 Tax=Edaphobacter flagellatus TaxID=1933044 RepID=UPI0021B3423F|nr:hypothetical protein [Edaphobacter flagellatus]